MADPLKWHKMMAKVEELEEEKEALTAEVADKRADCAGLDATIERLRADLAAAEAGGEEWRWPGHGDGAWTRPTPYCPEHSPSGRQVRTVSAWRDAGEGE